MRFRYLHDLAGGQVDAGRDSKLLDRCESTLAPVGQDLEVLVAPADVQRPEVHRGLEPVGLLLLVGDEGGLVDTSDHPVGWHLLRMTDRGEQCRGSVGDGNHPARLAWFHLSRPTDDARGMVVSVRGGEVSAFPWAAGTAVA